MADLGPAQVDVISSLGRPTRGATSERSGSADADVMMNELDPLPSQSNLDFVEAMYQEYLRDPTTVEPSWRGYFARLAETDRAAHRPRRGPSFQSASIFNPPARNGHDRRAASAADDDARTIMLQHRVDQLIRNYRVRGHRIAAVNPLSPPPRILPELDPAYFGLTNEDMDRPFFCDTIVGASKRTLREILAILFNTYCQSIGIQFMHIDELEIRTWLQARMEGSENHVALTRKQQLRILIRLTDAVIFEQFIQKKFIGAKSFSLEGGETLIPLLDMAIEHADRQGVKEVVLGMAHRGRLNVLANIMGKSAHLIFREFEDRDASLHIGHGDVKYHQGYSADHTASSGNKVHLSLCFNPSHLEAVNPVALGRLRAKQDRVQDHDRSTGMAILIHGDAAMAGEGVVQETLNMSELPGYHTGGTLHIVVNNQIGFTTSPHEARSTPYATAVARMLHIPIFHVNGEDPEAVAQAVSVAMDFRRTFKRDVVIDMWCYRRRGHNEGDEPSYTQPLLYDAINRRSPIREAYLDHLLKLGGVTRDEADWIVTQRRKHLENELSTARSPDYRYQAQPLGNLWSGYVGGTDDAAPEVDTSVARDRLAALLEKQTQLPADFNLHPKLQRWMEARREMSRGEKPLDWSAAEALAFASLLVEGARVRMSGQDSQRGTFSHRHAMLHDVKNGSIYTPLQHLAADQAPLEIINSPLSEVGVLGFEYGYTLDYPEALVLWEAQFGDFVNVAQMIVDQFIASAEAKWNRLSGLVLLLPHGFEGQGPEHSSARLERFLAMAAEDNMQVVNLTTPAQYFHCLRRQVVRKWRKPLVIMTPKSLLRSSDSVSTLDELAAGRFQRIIGDAAIEPGGARRVLLCSGKVYFDLLKQRQEASRQDVAIIRVEQLYPLADETLRDALQGYRDGIPVCWVQEEPENMGAWRYLRVRFGDKLFGRWPFGGFYRPAAASPATGSASAHKLEQKQLIERAFEGT